MITSESGKALIQTCLEKDETIVESCSTTDDRPVEERQRKKRTSGSSQGIVRCYIALIHRSTSIRSYSVRDPPNQTYEVKITRRDQTDQWSDHTSSNIGHSRCSIIMLFSSRSFATIDSNFNWSTFFFENNSDECCPSPITQYFSNCTFL